MYVKPFTAEQLYDSLIVATEAHKTGRNYEQSEKQRTEWLGQFVRTFGTDENNESTDFNGTVPQALVMMNGELTRNAISGNQGSFLRRVLEGSVLKGDEAIGKTKTSRVPAKANKATPLKVTKGIPRQDRNPVPDRPGSQTNELRNDCVRQDFSKQQRPRSNPQPAGCLLALLNSNEFIFNH